MKLVIHNKSSQKIKARLKNRVRIRRKLKGTTERPRLCIFKSAKHVYAQIVDDTKGITIVTASSRVDLKDNRGNVSNAKKIGELIAKKAMEKNVKSVVFDRSGYIYHGRVKSVADGAREAGLNF